MAEASKIEWCDSTFNPWIGCTKISPACDHCYAAELMDTRYGRVKWGGERSRTSKGNWQQPHRWQRQAAAFFADHGRRRRVFCSSLADVFDNQVPTEWRDDLWALIRDTPDLDWLLLTKRPQNIAKMLPAFWDEVKGHVWLGTTVEDQKRAEQNIPHLLQHDCAVRFVSCEPLLGQIDLTHHLWGRATPCSECPEDMDCDCNLDKRIELLDETSIDWVIAGGESGPHARPSHPDWLRSLRDQCADAGVPFLMKQWGCFVPQYDEDIDPSYWSAQPREFADHAVHGGWCFGRNAGQRPWMMFRRSKKDAGRLLDGVEHNGFPEAQT